jgi:hypothetical protein
VRLIGRLVVVATLLCAGIAVGASPARAEIPELGVCPVDAGIKLGDTGTSVFCLQFTMAMMRRYHGVATGVFDEATAEALRWYQSDNPPLAIDGVATKSTLVSMGVYSGVQNGEVLPTCQADAPVQLGDRGPSARCVQQRLADLGRSAAAVDGLYNTTTASAVQQFQADAENLDATGVADTRTLAAMGIWSGYSVGDDPIEETSSQVAKGPWPAPLQPEPQWRATPQGIPFFGTHRSCSVADANTIAAQFANDGADIDIQQWAVYIASREGGCDYRTVNLNLDTRDDSHCTFQLNALAGMFQPTGELGRRGWNVDNVKASMKNCADAASDLWVYCGKGPWTPPYSCTPPWEGDLGAEGDA